MINAVLEDLFWIRKKTRILLHIFQYYIILFYQNWSSLYVYIVNKAAVLILACNWFNNNKFNVYQITIQLMAIINKINQILEIKLLIV